MSSKSVTRSTTSTVSRKTSSAASTSRTETRVTVTSTPTNTPRVTDEFTKATTALVALDGSKPAGAKAEAIEKARKLLETGGAPRTKSVPGGIITNDTVSVNDPRDVKKAERATKAKAQVLDNAKLEGEALLGLSPKDRERYQKVKDTLLTPSPGKPHGDPVAALALQTMLLEGKLPGAKALGSKDTLLSGLEKMATQEVGTGIDRQQLLADVVQEVASPSAVSQTTKGTCSVTTAQIQLMRDNPAEYVRLVSGLASPAGEVQTVGGDVLKVEPAALTDSTGRSVSQRLLAPALMELGNGTADYQNGADLSFGGDWDQKSGLHTGQVDRVLESITGQKHAWTTQGKTEKQQRAVVATVAAQLEAGKSVMVGLTWTEGGGHQVLAVGTEQRNGGEYVKIINPWGTEESIPRAEFDARLISTNYES